jgi:hypothetical protein
MMYNGGNMIDMKRDSIGQPCCVFCGDGMGKSGIVGNTEFYLCVNHYCKRWGAVVMLLDNHDQPDFNIEKENQPHECPQCKWNF